MMDMTDSIAPRSDQINADDLIAGPMTVTIREVIVGKAEHPFDFLLAGIDRAYRPSKTMRRVIVNAWGPDASSYAGRSLTLYREPSIMFGGQKVGGIRISHMSDITGTLEVMAQTTRGKREKFTVQPLAAGNPTGGGDPSEVVQDPNQGQDTNGGSAGAEAAEPPTVPLIDAVKEQLAAMTSHQKSALHLYCREHEVTPTPKGLIDAWGERARDIAGVLA